MFPARFHVCVSGQDPSNTNQNTLQSESKLPSSSSANCLSDEKFHEFCISGFEECLKSHTVGPLAVAELAEETRCLLDSRCSTHSFGIVPTSQLNYFPFPYIIIKVKLGTLSHLYIAVTFCVKGPRSASNRSSQEPSLLLDLVQVK